MKYVPEKYRFQFEALNKLLNDLINDCYDEDDESDDEICEGISHLHSVLNPSDM